MFFDEIDGLAPPRGEAGGGVESRVMAQLLSEMDGLTVSFTCVHISAWNFGSISCFWDVGWSSLGGSAARTIHPCFR